MTYRLLLGMLGVSILVGLSARADTIVIRGREKAIEGTVKFEDAKSIVVVHTVDKKKVEESFPALDVVDIVHDAISPAELTTKGFPCRIAREAEKDAESDDPAKRKAALTLAVTNYNVTLGKMKRDTNAQKNAARQIEFKVAVLMVRQATDQGSGADKAIAKLQDFKTKFADSWQIHQVMPMIAQIQMDASDFKEAAKTFQEMADMPTLPADVRRDAELRVVEVMVRANDIAGANSKLDALEKKAAGSASFSSRVKLARADVLIGQKQFDKAIPFLQEVVKTNTDKQIKAIAHNTLGECLFKAQKYNEALWEFLWVDAVFNQDRQQHAKALYYLWKTFEQLNNNERAQECLQALEDRQFNGTEFQREAKKGK